MKQSSEREDAPIGTPKRPGRTEPLTDQVLGSSVCFSADGKYLTENTSQSNTRRIASQDYDALLGGAVP
jgi:hypothetical protein